LRPLVRGEIRAGVEVGGAATHHSVGVGVRIGVSVGVGVAEGVTVDVGVSVDVVVGVGGGVQPRVAKSLPGAR
jgi:hypothetical protein